MSLEELARLGESLRKAQIKAAGKTWDDAVAAARDWERRFDAAVKQVLHPPQPSLFGDKE